MRRLALLACVLACARAPARPGAAERPGAVRVVAARRAPEAAFVVAPADVDPDADRRRVKIPDACAGAPPVVGLVFEAGCVVLLVAVHLVATPVRLLLGDLRVGAPPTSIEALAVVEPHADASVQDVAAAALARELGPRAQARADAVLEVAVESVGLAATGGPGVVPFAEVRVTLRAGRRVVDERTARAFGADARPLAAWSSGFRAARDEVTVAATRRAAEALLPP